MFSSPQSFNQPIGDWDVGSVTNMEGMFFDTKAFNQDIGSWEVRSLTDMEFILRKTGMSTYNYEQTLQGWANQTDLPNGRSLDAVGQQYCDVSSRNILTSAPKNWIITGDVQDCTPQPVLLLEAAGQAIPHTSTQTEGCLTASATNVYTYTITNKGNEPLTLTLPVSNNADFTVETLGFTTSLNTDASTTFSVTLPTTVGRQAATITIGNNDPDYSAGVGYQFNIKAQLMTNPSRLYANDDASGAGDGSSWDNAFTDLSTALRNANRNRCEQSNIEIWVAKGTYRPAVTTLSNAQKRSFVMPAGVVVYGGFEPGAEALGDRDTDGLNTILSGDLAAADDGAPAKRVDNSYSVVRFLSQRDKEITSATLLDGFKITGGAGNNGAGVLCWNATPTIRNCIIENNYASNLGGGLYYLITDASNTFGLMTIDNCTFNANEAARGGGAAFEGQNNSEIALINCTINDNHADVSTNNGGGILQRKCELTIQGGVITNNTTLGYGGGLGLNDTASSPYGLQLLSGSPAINVGNDAAVPASITTDLAGNPRKNGQVDIGAYEQ